MEKGKNTMSFFHIENYQHGKKVLQSTLIQYFFLGSQVSIILIIGWHVGYICVDHPVIYPQIQIKTYFAISYHSDSSR